MVAPSRSVRLGLLALGIILTNWAAIARSMDQPAPAAPVPALKALGVEDGRQVEARKKTIDELRRAGKFTEALEPARKVLAICEEALGPDHWQTADARREIETLQ